MIEKQEIYYNYTGNGATAQFGYGCRIFAAANLRVTVAGVVKALGVDYTITGVDDIHGGEITFVPAAVPANGTLVELERVLDFKRDTGYAQNGDFRPETVDKDQDYQTALLQQMEFILRRVLLLPSDSGNDDLVLPPVANRKSKLLGFDADGKFAIFPASYTVVVQQTLTAITKIRADASAGPVTVNLPASGEVLIIKTDNTNNPVTVTPLPGQTLLLDPLSGKNETVRLWCEPGDTEWYQI